MEYLIRKCEPKDLDTLVMLCERHAAYERAEYSSEGKKNKLKVAIFGEAVLLHCLVVEVAQKIVGYASYTFDYSSWDAGHFLYLDCLYLDQDYRGVGIGEKLFQQVARIAKVNKCVNMQWQTPVFNERPIRFYNRMGGTSIEKKRFTLF